MLNPNSGFIEKKIRLTLPYSQSHKEPIQVQNDSYNRPSPSHIPFNNEKQININKDSFNVDNICLMKRKSFSITHINNKTLKPFKLEHNLNGVVIYNKNISFHKRFDEKTIIPWKNNECRFTFLKNTDDNKKRKMIYHKKRINTKENSKKKEKKKNDCNCISFCNQNESLNKEEISNRKDNKNRKHFVTKTNLSVLSPSYLSTQNNSYFGLNESECNNNKSFKGNEIITSTFHNNKLEEDNSYNFKFNGKSNLNITALKKIKQTTKIIYPVNNPIYHINKYSSHIRANSLRKFRFIGKYFNI